MTPEQYDELKPKIDDYSKLQTRLEMADKLIEWLSSDYTYITAVNLVKDDKELDKNLDSAINITDEVLQCVDKELTLPNEIKSILLNIIERCRDTILTEMEDL